MVVIFRYKANIVVYNDYLSYLRYFSFDTLPAQREESSSFASSFIRYKTAENNHSKDK